MGFTLIELLVVIAIIGVLIGIALPALGYARNRSRSVACMANLRSLAAATTLYRDQNRGVLPFANELYSLPSGPGWLEPVDSIAPFLDAPPPSIDTDGKVVTGPPYLCPSDDSHARIHGMSYAYIPAGFMQVISPTGAAAYVTNMLEDTTSPLPLFQDIAPWHPDQTRNAVYLDGSTKTLTPS